MTTIYYDYDARFSKSDREFLIHNGRGTLTPVQPVRGVKVQTIEVTDEELAIWYAAKDFNESHVWKGFGGRR